MNELQKRSCFIQRDQNKCRQQQQGLDCALFTRSQLWGVSMGLRWYSHAHLQFGLFYLIIVIIKLNTVLWVIYWNKMSLVQIYVVLIPYNFLNCCRPKIRFLLAWPSCVSLGNDASLAVSGATWMLGVGWNFALGLIIFTAGDLYKSIITVMPCTLNSNNAFVQITNILL